jgi:hypothetical protein
MVTSPKGLGPEKDYAGEGQQHIQKTDLSSRQRGRPTKTRPWLSKSNKYLVMSSIWGSTPRRTDWLTFSGNITSTWTLSLPCIPCGGGVEYLHRNPASRRRLRHGKSRIWDSKIWSRVPRDSDPRMTVLASASSNCKRQTRPFFRVSAPNQHTRNCLTVIKIWSLVPDGCSIPTESDRLTVGCNIRSRFSLDFFEKKSTTVIKFQQFLETVSLKNRIDGMFKRILVCAMVIWMSDVDCFVTGESSLIVARIQQPAIVYRATIHRMCSAVGAATLHRGVCAAIYRTFTRAWSTHIDKNSIILPVHTRTLCKMFGFNVDHYFYRVLSFPLTRTPSFTITSLL